MKKTYPFLLFALAGTTLFSQISTQAFISSGNFSVPSGITTITIEVVGAGGRGAGNGGGGGGGGGYAKGVYNVPPLSNIVITVGTPGTNPSVGTTSAGMLISATGGANGTTVSNPNIGGGGAGGVGSGGTVANRTGGTGGGAYWTYFGGGGGGAAGSVSNGANGGNSIAYTPGGCLTPGGSAGPGGGAPGGSGGKGAGFTDNACNNADPAAAGLNYGGGGGGGNGNSSPAMNGAGGYCEVTWNGCPAPAPPTNLTAAASLTFCGSGTTTLTATGTGTDVINWYTTSSGSSPVGTGTAFVTPPLNGNTSYYAEAVNSCTNSTTRTAITVTVNALPQVTITPASATICVGATAILNATGAASYTWSLYNPAEMTFSVGSTNNVQPAVTTNYTITGTSASGCVNTMTVGISVQALPPVNVTPSATTICSGGTVNLSAGGAVSYTWTPFNPAQMTFSTGAATSVQPITNASYTVTGMDANNCLNTAVTGITVNALPSVSITALGNIICIGQTIELTAGGAITYTWNNDPTVTTTVITVAPVFTTSYSVKGTGANGCENKAGLIVMVSNCTGINETAAAEKELGVYPNPNSGEFYITAKKDMQVSLVNELGQVVKTMPLNAANNHRFAISGLAAGVYFIVGKGDGQVVSRKVIISK